MLKEVNASAIVVDTKAELDGLSDEQIAAAAEAAKARKLEGKYVIALLNTTGQPPESQLTNRALRERLHKASIARGSRGGEFDNTAIVVAGRQAARRARQAARLPEPRRLRARGRDRQDAGRRQQACSASSPRPRSPTRKREAADMQAMIDKQKARAADSSSQPWDWAYYTEKVRQAKYTFDESQLKPYFEMNNVLENGVFFAADQLYGLTFKERTDLPVYHAGRARVRRVRRGRQAAGALHRRLVRARHQARRRVDERLRRRSPDLIGTKPVVANHLNIPKPPEGEPTLLTWDEVTTTFHEFGHALHGMFSNVKYPHFAGTSVPRDFVEYPSQVNEMWADWPAVLANYAKHYQTGAPMPKELLDKVLAASKFNQGFATTEYLGAAMLDQGWHQLTADQLPAADGVIGVRSGRAEEGRRRLRAGAAALPHAPTSATSWAATRPATTPTSGAKCWTPTACEWFKENGGLTRENGDHFRKTLLSRGGSEDALQLFRNFAGRDPKIEPLLEKRGLTGGKGAAATDKAAKK